MVFKILNIAPLFLIFFFSCRQDNEENKTVNEMATLKILEEKNYRTDTTLIFIDNFKFAVVSNYIYNNNQERPIFFDQIISILKKDGSVLYSSKHDGGYDSIKTNLGYMKFIRNFVTKIGVIKVENKNYFIVDGWGGCNDCSTYSAIIDENGKLQYKLFWNEKEDTSYSHIGDLNQIFPNKKDLKIYQKGEYNIIKKPCNGCVQSKINNSFNDPFNQ